MAEVSLDPIQPVTSITENSAHMDSEPPGFTRRPIPDPTLLTTEQLLREIANARSLTNVELEVLRERLRGMDVATRLLNETVNRVPTALQEGLGHLQSVMDERFKAIALQFVERDTRSEREARDNKVAVDAAFAAQKEAATKQDESNQKAIDKSEKSTNETINKLGEQITAITLGISGQIDDLKDRVKGIEARGGGVTEATASTRASAGLGLYAVIAVVALISLVLGFYTLSRNDNNQAPTTSSLSSTICPVGYTCVLNK